ncbi:MAG TPA: nucleotidyl transferase AbiEii/AbiGii toxin family protein, partial [Longimicrobiaceae bacterium]|nr:nucleotidyl transferase AbiEii/AbiGii toxin family protein [Longimicrobiaceae bacterium]
MELRLRHLARATKDLDLILNSETGDLIEELQGALSRSYQGFTFRVKSEMELMPNGAARVQVALQYLGKSWGTVQIDVARHAADGTEVEMVPAFSLAPFGLVGPDSLPCLSLPFHVAQKIHGMTLPPRAGRQNDRFRDLVDLLLLREWVSDFDAVQRACHVVFETRGTHLWPPFFDPPEHWADQFERMASDMALPVTDLYDAAIEIRRFITQIDESAEWMAELPSLDGLRATTWYFAFGPGGDLYRISAYIGESFFTGTREHDEKVLPEWQRVPGGLALIGVVLFLRNRKPVFVQGVSAKGFALDKTLAGESVEFGPEVWDALALELIRQARAPARAVNGLSIFLSNVPCRLPCVVAWFVGASTAQAHWWRTNWKWDWLL